MTGEISQDLDLFRMPVDLRIDTDGKTENKHIDVVRHKFALFDRNFWPPAPHSRRSRPSRADELLRC